MNRVSDPSSITSADAYIRHKMDRRVRLALGESAALYPSSSCNAGHPPGAWSPSLVLPLLMLAGYGWSSGRGGRRSKLLLLLSILLVAANKWKEWKHAARANGTMHYQRILRWRKPPPSTNKARGGRKGPLLLLLFHFTAQYYYVARELLVIPSPAAYCSRSRVFALRSRSAFAYLSAYPCIFSANTVCHNIISSSHHITVPH